LYEAFTVAQCLSAPRLIHCIYCLSSGRLPLHNRKCILPGYKKNRQDALPDPQLHCHTTRLRYGKPHHESALLGRFQPWPRTLTSARHAQRVRTTDTHTTGEDSCFSRLCRPEQAGASIGAQGREYPLNVLMVRGAAASHQHSTACHQG